MSESNFFDSLDEKYSDTCDRLKAENMDLKAENKDLKRKPVESEDSKTGAKSLKHRFTCDICSKTFKLKQHLTRHVLSHTSHYKCNLCERKFKRQDYLKKHLQRQHDQTGGRDSSSHKPINLPNVQTESTVVDDSRASSTHRNSPTTSERSIETRSPFEDHSYVRTPPESTSRNNAITDHDYARDIPSTSQSVPRDHNYSTNSALNDAVKDFIIIPYTNEKFDLLTFFANVKAQVRNLLFDRLKSNGIKWYLSIQVELLKDSLDEQTCTPHFRSKTYATLNIIDFDEEELNESFQKMFESFEKYLRDSSGWRLRKVIHLIVHTVNFSPLTGSSFMELPKDLRRVSSLLNIRNLDQKCFLWCCLAALHQLNSPLVSAYEEFENELNMNGINYPVTLNQINKVEKQNLNLSINVFTYEEGEILPLRITKQRSRQYHINLLLLQSENNSHYCLITNLNRFLSVKRKSHATYYYCSYCLHGFVKQQLLDMHIPYCQVNGEQKVELPSEKDCFIEFKDYEKTLRVPYVIYADFETLNKPLETGPASKSTTTTHLLEPCSFAYKIVSTDLEFTKDTVLYKGKDAPQKLLQCLFQESHDIQQRLSNIKPLDLTKEEEASFLFSKKCCLCQKVFLDKDQKARHHDHVTGKFIGATHMNCNLQCKQVNFIPVIFHNLKNFDAHLLCQSIGSFKDHRLNCIPQTMEKYISFSIGNLRFIDSFAFLPSSLDTLVENLAQDGFDSFVHFKSEIKEHTNFLLRKGVYPYEYFDSWEKFDECKLPDIMAFSSSLTKQTISEKEYEYAQDVFRMCNCKTLSDFHNIYLKSDVLLLADVFEQFRNMTLKCYQLDPCHFYTSPGLSWSAMLKMTGVTLQLMTDIDQMLFIEKGIRGGVSQISHRYGKANNPHLSNYDRSKESLYVTLYDVNNLYGHSMSEKLPVGFFTFLKPEEIESFDVTKIKEDSSKGYILEVDLEYPSNLHDSHNDFPLAPERDSISDDQLSPYAKRILKKLHGKNRNDTLPHRAKVQKLLTTLNDKDHYILHYKNLQLYLRLGLKLKKIHRVLEFEQEAFLKPYIDCNTEMRKNAKSTFEKNLFKLFNNSIYGKTMESVRKYRSVELCHTEKRLKKLSSKATYKAHRIFSDDLVGVELDRHKVKLNKPIYIGMTVLDLSKHLMYDFFYNYLKQVYGSKVHLYMMDTDSFLLGIESQNLFQDIYEYRHLFDTSDFPKDHFLYSEKNRKQVGFMKIETLDKCISEYCGLRSKMYAYSCDEKEDKKAKGISKCVVKNELSLQNYKDTLFEETTMKANMNLLRSHDHKIYSECINKISLSSFDDKRYILDDGISSLAYGHYKINQ